MLFAALEAMKGTPEQIPLVLQASSNPLQALQEDLCATEDAARGCQALSKRWHEKKALRQFILAGEAVAYIEGQLGCVAPSQLYSIPLLAPGCPHPVRQCCRGEPITCRCMVMEVAFLKFAQSGSYYGRSLREVFS